MSVEDGRARAAEADIVLRDGSTAHVRPVVADDVESLQRFLDTLSQEERRLRFFSPAVDLGGIARMAAATGAGDRFGLVALHGGRIVAHAELARAGPSSAEVSFAVAHEMYGQGLATTLLAHLAGVAEERGIAVFEADVLPDNHRMIQVFRESGFSVRTRSEPGTIHLELPTALGEGGVERFESRDRLAAVAAVESFLRPASIAMIGASRDRSNVGGSLFHNLLSAGFAGPVYPVNPAAATIQSVVAYPSLDAVPGPVELALVAVPAEAVIDVARDCARHGVHALIVISAGFAEVGEGGARRQRDLLEVCREAGMRLLGPNCLGIINATPGAELHATFSPTFPPAGNVGFMSQSGALGLAVLEYAPLLGFGLSAFVSAGNKADISGNDLIQYWEDDRATQVILLYLESFGNPRRFARIARRVARTKPILVVKSGRSGAGARATSSHTGALLAASDATVDALFRQAGVIRADTLAELFDVANLLATSDVPAGGRIGIATNAGGPGILCADACAAAGLDVPALSEAVRAALASAVPQAASTQNPVDLLATASADDYRRAVRVLRGSGEIDVLIAIFIPPLVTSAEDVAEALAAEASPAGGPPTVAVFMGADGSFSVPGGAISTYAFPEQAAVAVGHAVRYARFRERDPGEPAAFDDLRSDEAASMFASALGAGHAWLAPADVAALLDCYGVAQPDFRIAADARGAGAAADELGGAVALKASASTLVHKTEAGGVRLGLSGSGAVEAAAAEMAEQVGAAGHSVDAFVVQRMGGGGSEMIVGVVQDALFGPVVACGAGGTAAELIGDVQVRITPLTRRDADEMVRSLQTFPLLDGYRGAPKRDVDALVETVLRIGTMVERHPEIAELDLNPVMVGAQGAVALDARVRVAPPPPRDPWPSLNRPAAA